MRIYILSMITSLLAVSCGGGKEWQKNPVDTIIRDLDQIESYSIILYDMDVEGNFSKTYKHKYKIVKIVNDEPQEEITDWMPVPEQVFFNHENDMGMEIVSKSEDGKISKTAAPPGYSNYVGNEKYGHWVSNSSGGSFWEFYGKYAMMSSLFNMAMMPVRMSYWNDFHHNYYGSRAYYGPSVNGSRMYGTQSAFQRKTRANSTWSRKSKSSSMRNSFSSRTSRSSSRWGSSSGGFSSRSRSGGFGK